MYFESFQLENLFSPFELDTYIYNGLKPFKQIIVEGHIRIIPVSLVKIHPIMQEEMSFEAIVDEGQRAIKTKTAHFEPMNQVR